MYQLKGQSSEPDILVIDFFKYNFLAFIFFLQSFITHLHIHSFNICWGPVSIFPHRLSAQQQQADALLIEPHRTLIEPPSTLIEPRRTLNLAMPYPKLSHAVP